MACTPPPAWGGLKISEKSLLGGSEVFILVGGGGGYIVGGKGNFVGGDHVILK